MLRNGWLWAVVTLAAALTVVGCGGGGSASLDTQSGTLTGSISLGGLAAGEVTLQLDGAPVDVPIAEGGGFVLPSVPPGDHRLEVIGPDGESSGGATFTIEPGEELEIPPIELEPAGEIVGKVLVNRDGTLEPLVGVEVVARSDLAWIMTDEGAATCAVNGDDPSRPLIYPPPEGMVYSAVTGDDGSYAMPGVRPGSYLVAVVAPGYEPGLLAVVVEAGGTAVADFELKPIPVPGVGTIQGTVTDSEGAPLEGALVTVTLDTGWVVEPPVEVGPLAQSLRDSGQASGTCIVPPPLEWWEFRTLTDSAGHYSLNVPSGACQVSAWRWDYEYQSRSVRLKADTVLTQDFKLGPADVTVRPD